MTALVLIQMLLKVLFLSLHHSFPVSCHHHHLPRCWSTSTSLTHPSKTRAALSEQPGLSKCTDQGEANRPIRLPDAYVHPRLSNPSIQQSTIPS